MDTIAREALTFTFHRTLEATPDDVFDAWTQPELISRWWDPSGAPLARCEVDLRVGGAFRFENDGHSHAFTGVYQVVERPRRLVFDALGAHGTVTVEANGARTDLRVTIRCSSAEHFERFREMGIAADTGRTLDNLTRLFPRRIALTRVLRATPTEVWEMWTTVAGIESWWGPDGFRVEVRRLDLRPGGELRYAMIAVEDDRIAFMKSNGMPTVTETGLRYVDVDPPRRLAYVNVVDFVPGHPPYESGTVLRLEPVASGTHLELTFDVLHAPEWTDRARMGWEQELDKLVARLEAK
jgi:uncharacterized protein YndB with AHSA1/START domain